MDNVLMAMLQQHNTPVGAEMHLAECIVLLDALNNITSYGDTEMNKQLIYCRELMSITHE
jgi:hypothetical protein